MDPLLQQLLFFGLNFLIILAQLLFYAIFFWVITMWLVMFGILDTRNRLVGFLSQLVQPILRPFSWAKIGMIDLSPIVAILLLDLAIGVLRNGLVQLVG